MRDCHLRISPCRFECLPRAPRTDTKFHSFAISPGGDDMIQSPQLRLFGNLLRCLCARVGLLIGVALLNSSLITPSNAADAKSDSAAERIVNKPKTPGQLVLHQRTRTETANGSGEWKEGSKEVVEIDSETAIIICDIGDGHYCVSTAKRVANMVPRMNAVLTAARNHGATVIHSPSGVTYHYADMPQRKRMQQATKYKPEIPLEAWCYVDPKREPELP